MDSVDLPVVGAKPVVIPNNPIKAPSFNVGIKSFKDVLSNKGSGSCADASSLVIHPTTFRGKPAVLLSDHDIEVLSAPFAFTLIGKFIFKRPSLEAIRSFFFRLKLLGEFKIGLLDNNHISIKLQQDLDYARIFGHRTYTVNNCLMRLLKWSPDFDVKEESPIVPIWISFPNLRLHLINQSVIYALGSILGRPLQMDLATANLSRPSVARVLVEMDITKKYPSEIWVGSENHGYFQKVVIEDVPLFCGHCKKHGHLLVDCVIAHPELVVKKSGLATSIINLPIAVPELVEEPVVAASSILEKSITDQTLLISDDSNVGNALTTEVGPVALQVDLVPDSNNTVSDDPVTSTVTNPVSPICNSLRTAPVIATDPPIDLPNNIVSSSTSIVDFDIRDDALLQVILPNLPVVVNSNSVPLIESSIISETDPISTMLKKKVKATKIPKPKVDASVSGKANSNISL